MRLDSAVAVPAGEDLRTVTSRLDRAHEHFMRSRTVPSGVRSVVVASWQRCDGLSPDGRPAPVRLDADRLAECRAGHPLAALLPMFRELLGGDHIFAVTDAAGTLLWVEGDAATRRRAERMNFAAGAGWSEPDAGTNAPGTALAVVRPVQIVRAEHYNSLVHPWVCAAAPIRDPVRGQVLGVIDITGGESVASPHALGLVRATARLAEAELARWARPGPPGPGAGMPAAAGCLLAPRHRPPLPGVIRLSALGRDCALAQFDGRVLELRPRHSEIVVILALADGGLPGPRLAVRLSETDIHPVTLRAEMSRLRALLGCELLGSHPYLLRRPVRSDFADVLALLDRGQVDAALAAYPGPLLPGSDAPAIAQCRAALDQQLRAEVLASGGAGLLRRWVNADWGAEDIEAWQALARALPAGSPQRSAAAVRARALDQEMAAPAPGLGVTEITSAGCRSRPRGRPQATVRQRSRS
jgi:hypothetical protein